MSIQIFCPCFDWVVLYKVAWDICILWRLIHSQILFFAKIFSHCVGCFFIFFYGTLCCAKPFKFNEVSFRYSCFYFHYSGSWIKQDIAAMSKSVSAYVFLQEFSSIKPFVFPYKLKFFCPSSVKKVIDILIGIALNLWIVLDSMVIFTVIIPLIHEDGISINASVVFNYFHQCHNFLSIGFVSPQLNVYQGILFFLMQL